MRVLLILIFVSANIATFAQPKPNFFLNGVVKNGYAYKIFLRYTKDDSLALGIDVDDVALIKDGKFSFSGYITEPVQAHFVLDGHASYASIYLDTGTIAAALNITTVNELTAVVSKPEVISVQGSVSDSLQRQFYATARSILKLNAPDSVKGKTYYEQLLQFTRQHSDHNLSSEFLRDASHSFLTYRQATLIYNTLSKRQQGKASRNGVEAFLERIKKIEAGYCFMPLPDPAGNLISGKEHSYSYMLVYFWASWAHQDFTSLASLYKKYHHKGFEILGVSIDSEREDWLAAIKDNTMVWPQVSDLKGRENELYTFYHIPYVTFSMLVDHTGKIISVDLRGEELKQKIESLFPL